MVDATLGTELCVFAKTTSETCDFVVTERVIVRDVESWGRFAEFQYGGFKRGRFIAMVVT